MVKTFLQNLILDNNFTLVKRIIYHLNNIDKEDNYNLVKLCVFHNDITFLKFIEEKAHDIKNDVMDVIFFYLHIFNNDTMEYLLENYINDMNQKEIDRLFINLSIYAKDTHILEFFIESYYKEIPQQTLDDALYDNIKENVSTIVVIRYLLNLGANVNYTVNSMEQRGEGTCLLNAIDNQNLDVVEFLLKNRANVFYDEYAAIKMAYDYKDFEILQALFKHDNTSEDYFFKHTFSDLDIKLCESYYKKRRYFFT